jgi:hypothetical protein
VLNSGGRWADAPLVFAPRKTLYNRFVRWAAKGVWVDILIPRPICKQRMDFTRRILGSLDDLRRAGAVEKIGAWLGVRWTLAPREAELP